MNQLQQQLQAVERGVNELQSLSFGLDELPGSEGKEILAQIGRGIYAKAKIISEELMVNIGDNNFVTRSIPEAKELLEGQIKKLQEVESDLEKSIEFTNKEFMEMVQEYQNKKE